MNARDRAAQAKKWEWFEGMYTGDALVVSVRDGQITEVVFDGELMEARAEPNDDGDWYDTRGTTPYFTEATIGCIERGLLPKAWASVADRVEIYIDTKCAWDQQPAYRAKVFVWSPGSPSSWRLYWIGEKCSDRVDALIDCMEAAP